MTDTPEHVKKIHLQIWLSKPPGERLRQFLINNGEMYEFWRIMKQQMTKQHPPKAPNVL
jgi:hypothetical protein